MEPTPLGAWEKWDRNFTVRYADNDKCLLCLHLVNSGSVTPGKSTDGDRCLLGLGE